MPDELMTIKQMCDQYKVTPRTLRFYEAKEILSPIRQGRRGLYSKEDHDRLITILRWKRYGFSLDEMFTLLAYPDDAEGQKQRRGKEVELAAHYQATMQAERERLAQCLVELEGFLAAAPSERHPHPEQNAA